MSLHTQHEHILREFHDFARACAQQYIEHCLLLARAPITTQDALAGLRAIAYCGIAPEVACVVRIFDRVRALESFVERTRHASESPLSDIARDIACYSLLGLALHELDDQPVAVGALQQHLSEIVEEQLNALPLLSAEKRRWRERLARCVGRMQNSLAEYRYGAWRTPLTVCFNEALVAAYLLHICAEQAEDEDQDHE
ncbi:MAG: hypothetical protein N3A02_00145 [Rectinema sp.]|nr:hypothetical protein [Rectinema sp.]